MVDGVELELVDDTTSSVLDDSPWIAATIEPRLTLNLVSSSGLQQSYDKSSPGQHHTLLPADLQYRICSRLSESISTLWSARTIPRAVCLYLPSRQ